MSEATEVWRIYTAEDGKSRMQPVPIAMEAAGNGSASKLLAGPGVILRRIPHDIHPEWHNAPRRQLIATLKGEGEIETGDGQVLVLRAGVVTVVEDVDGVGHITRGRGSEDRLCLFLPLSSDTVLS